MQSPYWHYNSGFDPVELIKKFELEPPPEPDAKHLTNFIGVKISPRFFPGVLENMEGMVEIPPVPANWHADMAEWASALRAVDEAGDTFRVAELGCGWGCWLNNTGTAAKIRGKQVYLVGIEGDLGHVGFALEALETNGFKPSEYQIIHGIAAAASGKAIFPTAEVSGQSWGLGPVFGATEDEIESAVRAGTHNLLEMFSLEDMSDGEPFDLLHIDIQGGETDYIEQNLASMSKLVRRVLIGTHSRQIEGRIMERMLDSGWLLEMERPAIFAIIDGVPDIRVDGVQLYHNPFL